MPEKKTSTSRINILKEEILGYFRGDLKVYCTEKQGCGDVNI